MAPFVNLLGVVGWILLAVGGFFVLVIAFQKGTWWGIGMLFLGSILWPIFILLHWNDTKYWFLVALSGGLIRCVVS
jgi:hypothetical protein